MIFQRLAPPGPLMMLALLLSAPGSALAERITLEDLDRVVGVSSPRISPDGQSVVIVTTRPDLEENVDRRQLVLIDVASGDRQPLTHDRPGVSRPRWSPDGERLAFIDKHGEDDPKPQVLVLPLRGGEARAVTSAPQGVAAFEWSADGEAVLYLGADAPAEPPEGPERHNQAFAVGYHDYLATKAPPVMHLWRQSLDGGEAQRINGDDIVAAAGQFSWLSVSGDGAAAAFVGLPADALGDPRKAALMVIDLDSGERRDAFGEGLNNVLWGDFSPDGELLAYASNSGGNPFYSSPAISVARARGEEGEVVSSTIDRGLWGAQWMPDGQALVIGGNDDARKTLWLQPLDGAPRKLDLDGLSAVTRYGPPDLDIAGNGAIALVASAPNRPPELYWMNTVDSAPRALTDYNTGLGALELGRSEEIRWETDDGFEANGVLIYPPDFDPDKRYPLVLKIHGGPMSATTLTWDGFGQVLAARGFIVFGPNYRGSDNLGNDFQSAIIHDAGAGPGRDVMAGVAAIRERGIVDEERIGVSGWSYGGYMTSWLIGNYPDTWRAAMAGAPVTEYFDQYTLSDMNVSFGWGFDKQPWSPEGQAQWREQSPIAHLHKATTPTLILCNTGDLRVPITESYKLFHVLRDQDTPVEFIAYPIPGHFPADPVHRRDVFRRWADWMEARFEAPRDAPVTLAGAGGGSLSRKR
jgi:dipeptidyl aminopeptidase/acylaminoacyl peptidase